MVDWKFLGGITALGGLIGYFGAKTIDVKKLPAGEKAVLTGASTGATMEGLDLALSADDLWEEGGCENCGGEIHMKEPHERICESCQDYFEEQGEESFNADTNPRERRLRQRLGIKKPKSKPKKISNNFIEEGKIVTITASQKVKPQQYTGKILNIWETGTFTYMNVAFPLVDKNMKMNEAEIKTNNPLLWGNMLPGGSRPQQTHWGMT